MMSIQTQEQELTYEERLRELGKIVATHEVRVISDRFGVTATLKYHSEEEAREVALWLIDGARWVHEELECKGRYEGDYSGVSKLCTNEELFHDWNSPLYGKGWKIEVWCRFPKHPFGEMPLSVPEFVFGHRFGANRVANPDSKVFVLYSGEDCDHSRWAKVREYKSLREAAEDCEREQENADGPMGYSVISEDEFETF